MTSGIVDVGANVALVGGNVLLEAAPTPPPPSQNALLKFLPGDYISSDSWGADATNSTFQLEMNTIANDTSKTFIGYMPMWKWANFESATQGVYDFSKIDGIVNFFVNAMALKGRVGYIGIGFAAFSSVAWTVANLATNNPTNPVPHYIATGGSATWGPGPPTSSFSGWWAQNYNSGSGTFGFIRANTCNTNVQNAFNAMITAMASHQITMTAGAFTGQTFTLDTCPHIAFIADIGPDDIAMLQNPSNTTPTNWSPNGFYANWFTQMTAMSGAWTHTPTLMMPGYGAGGSPPSGAAYESVVLSKCYSSRVAISATDCFADQTQLSYSQQQTIGNSYTSGSVLVQGGGTDYRPLAMIAPTVEGPDYQIRTGTYAALSIPLVQGGIADVMKLLKAQYRIWNICSGNALIPGDFNNFVRPGVANAIAGGNKAVTLLPPQYMIAPEGLVASSITNTSFVLTWNTITGIGTGITYTVFLNGIPAVGGTGITNPPATIGGLNPNTTYEVTVATVNAYGTGPQSAQLSVTTT